MSARDSQRSKLFAAQKALIPFPGLDLPDFKQTVLTGRRWKLTYGPCTVRYKTRNNESPRCACVWAVTPPDGILELCADSDTPHIFLHGLAHIRVTATASVALHGPQFAREFLALVRRYLGNDAYLALKDAYKEHGVKTRTMSPEAREAARERYLDRQADNLEGQLRELSERIKGTQR